MFKPDLLQGLKAAHAWHGEIQQDEVGGRVPNRLQDVLAGACLGDDIEASRLQQTDNAVPKKGVIIGDHHASSYQNSSGCDFMSKVTVTRVP